MRFISVLLIAFIFSLPYFSSAQAPKLVCPFENGSGREPKEAFSWEPKDLKVIMISNRDSIIRSSFNGTVSNVELGEDNKYEVVIYYKNYYIWYSGVSNPRVKKNQNVNAGEAIGSYSPGTELEFRLYKDEEQIDPRNLLDCKIPKD